MLRGFALAAPRLNGARPLARDGLSFVADGDMRVRFDRHGTHLERSSLVAIDIEREDLANVAPVLDDAALVRAGAAPDTDVVDAFDGVTAEEFRVLRSPRAPTVFSWRLRLGPGIARVAITSGFVQAFDGEGRARFRSEPLVAWDAEGRERTLAVEVTPIASNEVRLVARLDTAGLVFPIAVDPAWGPANKMGIPRYETYLVRLPSGAAFVTGGRSQTVPYIASTETFDPSTRTWTVRAPMKTARGRHGMAVLSDGRVMVTGGAAGSFLTSCEIYDPATDTWTDAAPLPAAACAHATTAVGGKVIVAGGVGNTPNTYTYSESTSAWTTNTSKLATGRYGAIAIAFSATMAIVAGGSGYPATDLYDSVTNTFTSGPNLGGVRPYPGVALLSGGRVLIVGGGRLDGDLFEPPGTITTFSGLTITHDQGGDYPAALATVAGDKAVFVGGYNSGTTAVATDVFDLASRSWSRGPDIASGRYRLLSLALADGRALVAGGSPYSSTALVADTDLYANNVAVGGGCTAGGQCASGLCADGVCCDRACGGACESCVESGSVGTCKLVTGAPRAGHGTCVGSGTCGGSCDGTSAACSYPSSSVACVAGSCTAGTEQPPAYCNAGACAAAPPTKSCGLFACGTLTCKTSCAVDADCVSTAFCNTTTSACEPKKPSGSACTSGSACASGFCASGVCCDKACTGACESCNASGSVGLCQTRPSGTTCGADACVGSSLTVAAKCDGAATTCPAPAPTACPGGLVCADGKTCKTSCATGTDCTSGYCDLATGKCGTPPGDGGVADTGADTGIGVAETGAPAVPAKPSVDGFQRCRKSSECSTGFCVDGVCCDSACGDRCHSCALLTSPGKCTVEPIGVDLRNECGPANQCLGTCDGTGQCIGAGTGTMCGRNRCTTASAGVGAAYCSAPGAKCPLDEATPFECAPFACEPAFGACLTACVSSTDCANGFVCDLASKTCVAPAPAAEDSGCGVHGGAAPFGAWVVALLLAAGARRTRTSTSPRAR